VYHVFNRGVARLPIFLDTRDRVGFLDGLGDVVERGSWTCLAYCLMGNHFHLLVDTPSPTPEASTGDTSARATCSIAATAPRCSEATT
jgi:REP element-mobilizing transposase RayT